MNRNSLKPLGVPSADYDFGNEFERQARQAESSGFDRWLMNRLRSELGESTIAILRTLINPGLNFGDMYAAGRISIQGDLLAALNEAYRYLENSGAQAKLLARARVIAPDLAESKRNIHHHYDLGNEFYKLWLDREAMQYTCAYYAEPDMSIEQAQQAKLHHVARKLQLKAGEAIVEAGGGWGGLAIFMAKNYGVNVRSFNISKEQIAYSRAWAERESVSHLVEFVEDDFRNMTGEYDAFVSIGMLEHVGPGNYAEMGRLMARVLKPEGRGLVHTIGRDRPGVLNPWIDKRIFPGAHPPTLREMMDLFEDTRLSVRDVENIRLHYAETLRDWLIRYEENVDAVRAMFDESFVRAWRLYLAGSIMAFMRGNLQLFQVVFSRSGYNEIPRTREHIYHD